MGFKKSHNFMGVAVLMAAICAFSTPSWSEEGQKTTIESFQADQARTMIQTFKTMPREKMSVVPTPSSTQEPMKLASAEVFGPHLQQ